MLHDRLIPGTRANIDHIVVAPGGVWVVDSKRYRGQTPALRVEGGLFRPRVDRLVVGGRDRTRLVDGVLGQVAVVREALPDVPVTGALCFIDAGRPLIGGAFVTRGVHVVRPKRLAKRLGESQGKLDVGAVAATLAARFRPA